LIYYLTMFRSIFCHTGVLKRGAMVRCVSLSEIPTDPKSDFAPNPSRYRVSDLGENV